MGEPTVNGDFPHSATIDHVAKYPVVSDTISAFQNNPYGQKSIDLTNNLYATFVKPTIPYLEKPASYVKPYVAKVDEIGDSFLSKFDEKVPIVKSEASEIKSTAIDYAHWPAKVASEQKDYYYKTYTNEYKRCGGDGVVAAGKALIGGSFVVTSDWLSYFASLLQKSKKEAASKASEAKKEAESKASEAKETVKEKTDN